ncbi:MAG: hypothetical protein AAGD22_14710 [Verrucomicrobiota bacterium]
MLTAMMARFLLLGLACVMVGCASMARRASEVVFDRDDSEALTLTMAVSANDSSKAGPAIELETDDLEDYRDVTSSRGSLIVEGPRGYRRLIEELAWLGGGTLRETEEDLGIRSDLELQVVLLPMGVDEWPSKFSARIEGEDSRIIIPVLFDARTRSLAAFLREKNFFSTGVAGHEYFEFSACVGGGNLRVAADPEIEWHGIPMRARSFTRWYRDGMADYAAIVWIDKLNGRAGVLPEDRISVVHQENAEASLKRLGARIFDWTQFRKVGNTPYYEASLGLMLRLEEAYGREKIRVWNEAIARSTSRFKVREDLLRGGEDVFGVDLRRVARGAKE